MRTRSRLTWTHVVLLAFLVPSLACDRVEVDPAVADRPLPAPGDPVDTVLAAQGERIYQSRCVACHKLQGEALVGPTLGDVAARRDYEWIRGFVLSPDSMLRTDSAAMELLKQYTTPMPDPGLDEARFRAVLEFLRREAGGS